MFHLRADGSGDEYHFHLRVDLRRLQSFLRRLTALVVALAALAGALMHLASIFGA